MHGMTVQIRITGDFPGQIFYGTVCVNLTSNKEIYFIKFTSKKHSNPNHWKTLASQLSKGTESTGKKEKEITYKYKYTHKKKEVSVHLLYTISGQSPEYLTC